MRQEAHLTARDSQALPSSAPSTTWALGLPHPLPGRPSAAQGAAIHHQHPPDPSPDPSGGEGRNCQSANGREGKEEWIFSTRGKLKDTKPLLLESQAWLCALTGEACPAGTGRGSSEPALLGPALRSGPETGFRWQRGISKTLLLPNGIFQTHRMPTKSWLP